MKSISPSDVELLIALIDIGKRAAAAIAQIKTDKPEVYAAVGEHHRSALEKLEAAAGE